MRGKLDQDTRPLRGREGNFMHKMRNVLLDGQGMRSRDGVAIEECEELAESIKEGPVGEQTDTLVGVDGSSCTVGGGGFVWILA